MDIVEISSDIKCISATTFSKKRIEKEYMIKMCADSALEVKTFEERAMEAFIFVQLLENIQFLNYRDKRTGEKICNCNLNKIYNLK